MEVLKRSEIAQPSHSRSKTRQVPLALLPEHKANSFPRSLGFPLLKAMLLWSRAYRKGLPASTLPPLPYTHSFNFAPMPVVCVPQQSMLSWRAKTPQVIPRTHDGACSIGSIALLTWPIPKSILVARVPCIRKFHLGEALLVVICHLPRLILWSENSHSLNSSKKKCLEQEVHVPHQHSH